MSSAKSKVILRTDVPDVGEAGDIKDVARGFARNFLFPRSLAYPATPQALVQWKKNEEKRAKISAEKRTAAEVLASKLSGVTLSFVKPANSEGELFGSVGKMDLLKSLKACGYEIDKNSASRVPALKKTGDHAVELKLHSQVTAKVKVTITASAPA